MSIRRLPRHGRIMSISWEAPRLPPNTRASRASAGRLPGGYPQTRAHHEHQLGGSMATPKHARIMSISWEAPWLSKTQGHHEHQEAPYPQTRAQHEHHQLGGSPAIHKHARIVSISCEAPWPHPRRMRIMSISWEARIMSISWEAPCPHLKHTRIISCNLEARFP